MEQNIFSNFKNATNILYKTVLKTFATIGIRLMSRKLPGSSNYPYLYQKIPWPPVVVVVASRRGPTLWGVPRPGQ